MDNRPIGVFDSGLGGLTGVRELRKRLPHEEIIYFGDTGRVPYGSRSPETILQYARQDVAFLLSKNVKCIMAACGTVSSTYPAAEAAKLPVPYLGVVDAAAREAAFATRNRRIGVIGTAATIRSRSYEKLLRQLVPGVEITAQACPLFVPLVEAGYVDHSEESRQQVTKLVIAQYLTEVREAGVDTLILGCTHYPLLKTMIGEFMGQKRDAGGSGQDRRPPSGTDALRARPESGTGARGSGALLRERCAGQLCADGRPVPGRVQGRPGGSDRH